MSVRILHAADLHLDSPFEALTLAQAAQRRREQRSLLRALPELAQAHGAQIILLAGDLLDSASPYPETAKALAETFRHLRSAASILSSDRDHKFLILRHKCLLLPSRLSADVPGKIMGMLFILSVFYHI